MAYRPPDQGPSERKHARPVPDTDSPATDDRSTRPHRSPQRQESNPPSGPLSSDREPDGIEPDDDPDDGNYIGDPRKPDYTIRAADPPDPAVDVLDGQPPAAIDVPTIIRDAKPAHEH